LGSGSTFEIYLPKAEAAMPAANGQVETPIGAPQSRGDLILFVDDDRSMREMVGPALKEHGFRVITAANGSEALALFQQHEKEMRLLLTDLAMPIMDGRGLIQAVRLRRPELPIVLMTGQMESLKGNTPEGISAMLSKPFRFEQLLNAINNVLRSPATAVAKA
jgi:DNA-binding NtrC family response regulator